MPLIQIMLLEGRDGQKKQRLIEEVTIAVSRTLEVDPTSIRVILQEIPPAHWAVGGVPINKRKTV